LNKNNTLVLAMCGILSLWIDMPSSLAQEIDLQDSSTAVLPGQRYTQAQLDQILAPIALYPDPLLGQILMASTYPLEVVEASRWLQSYNRVSLSGDQLAVALAPLPWDPSVKSLTAFPQVLSMMDANIPWMEQLGDAFIAQQQAVMSAVQILRQKAETAGSLRSTPQQVVSLEGGGVVIEPQDPEVVYVPIYNPMLAYGSWSYPEYPPYNFYPSDYPFVGSLIGFGVGLYVVDSLWGWDHWDWSHHRLDIDDRRFSNLNRGHSSSTTGVWQHDPSHRLGVPYRDVATRAHFLNASSVSVSRVAHGYSTTMTPQNYPAIARAQRSSMSEAHIMPALSTAQNHTSEMQKNSPHAYTSQKPAVPMMESFSHGPDVRAQSERGAMSRSMPSVSVKPQNIIRGAHPDDGAHRLER